MKLGNAVAVTLSLPPAAEELCSMADGSTSADEGRLLLLARSLAC